MSHNCKTKYEILKMILSHLPSRKYAAQVNRAFYRAVCEIENAEEIYRMNFHASVIGEAAGEVRVVSYVLSNF